MTDSILRVPYGTRDILPGEGALRQRLETRIGRLFAAWGYDEVDTPTFEYADTFAMTGDRDQTAFRFLDRRGRTLMLRTDMTAPIARMVATRFRHHRGSNACPTGRTSSVTKRPRPAASANLRSAALK